MKNLPNVLRLADRLGSDANIITRQRITKEAMEAIIAHDRCSPVAYAGAVVGPDGEINTVACLIEPEHVGAVVAELSALIERLLAFSQECDAKHIAPVLPIKRNLAKA